MFSPAICSSSSHPALPLAASADEKINAIEEKEASISTAAPYLPPELIEKILYFLVTPYEPIKSAFNLYSALWVRVFHERVHQILNEIIKNHIIIRTSDSPSFSQNYIFHDSKLTCKDIAVLVHIKKRFTRDINKILSFSIEKQMKECNEIIHTILNKPSYYTDDQAEYSIQYLLKNIQHIKVDFYDCEMRKSMILLKILSEKTNIENLSIIGGGIFASNIIYFVNRLEAIVSQNKKILTINEINLRRANFNGKKIIEKFGAALAGKNVINLVLSENKIEEKQVLILSRIIKNIKINKLHISFNNIGDEGFQHIVNALPEELTYLNINAIGISLYGANLLLNRLRTIKTKIEQIDLIGNGLFEHQFNLEDVKNEAGQLIKFNFGEFKKDFFGRICAY